MTGAPNKAELEAVCRLKYGAIGDYGWGPRMRREFGYYTPDDWYEALVAKLVTPKTRWLDVGCGRHLFPSNDQLAARLSETCEELVGLDPDPTINENPFVYRKVHAELEEFSDHHPYDLITLRMVAEHVKEPVSVARKLGELVAAKGVIVVYTVYRWSPVSIMAKLVPHRAHHVFKRLLWQSEEKDTFPVVYKLNTRSDLRSQMAAADLREDLFLYLDDCRTTARFRVTHFAELATRSLLRKLGFRYPELCLLATYVKNPVIRV